MKLSAWLLALAGLALGCAVYFVGALALDDDFGIFAIVVGLTTSVAAMFSGAWGKEPAIPLAVLTGAGLIATKIAIAVVVGGAEATLPPDFQLNQGYYEACMNDARAWADGGKNSPNIFVGDRKYYWHVKDSPSLQPGDLNRFKIEWVPRLEKWSASPPDYNQWQADVTASAYEGMGLGARIKQGFSFFNILGFLAGIAAAYFAMATRKPLVEITRTTKANDEGVHEIN
ncbi:MAG: hypothetical protein ACYTDT_08820 [Planctomycetota bacterium]|jgi:hypothetical protein